MAATRGGSVGVGGENVRWRNQRTGEERKETKNGTGGSRASKERSKPKMRREVELGGIDDRRNRKEITGVGGRTGDDRRMNRRLEN
eukprot:jgi/Psemu1/39016/gm1.39016_g